MTSLAKLMRPFAMLMGLAAAALATSAHAQTSVCGVTGSATAAPAVYDPFNPTGLATTSITLNMTRVNNSGGGDTRLVNFYLRANPTVGTGADGTIIKATGVGGSAAITGLNTNIFYNYSLPAPIMRNGNTILAPTATDPSFMQINFTGNNAASNTAQVTFSVSLPPNLNLSAIQALSFDVFFSCNIQGGQSNGLAFDGSFANAVTFPVTVLSALRTYYAGTALDFGEIGNVTTGSLSGTPVRTSASNYVFVQSSGAYSVTLSSQNGFKLFRPGATTNADKVNYQLRFLGQNVNPTTTPTAGATAITRSCQRATLAASGNVLPIQATLLEGGSGKTPAPNYSDTLTITITPLIYSNTGTDACGSFGL